MRKTVGSSTYKLNWSARSNRSALLRTQRAPPAAHNGDAARASGSPTACEHAQSDTGGRVIGEGGGILIRTISAHTRCHLPPVHQVHVDPSSP